MASYYDEMIFKEVFCDCANRLHGSVNAVRRSSTIRQERCIPSNSDDSLYPDLPDDNGSPHSDSSNLSLINKLYFDKPSICLYVERRILCIYSSEPGD